jgi:hypothetical protein
VDIEDDDVETPTMFERYEDDTGGEVKHAPDADDEEVTLEEMDDYLGAEVLLPLGDMMVTGRVRGRKRDREGSLHAHPWHWRRKKTRLIIVALIVLWLMVTIWMNARGTVKIIEAGGGTDFRAFDSVSRGVCRADIPTIVVPAVHIRA